MNTEIEKLDRRRLRNLEVYLSGFVLFLILSITRYFFRLGGLNSKLIGQVVLGGLILSLLLLVLSTYESIKLARKIKGDPELGAILRDELVRTLEVQSWQAAYFGAAGTTLFFAISWCFYPVCDPVMIALTSIITGAGAYQATFYFKYRSV